MSERTLPAGSIDIFDESVNRPCLFIFADFPTTPRRIWTGVGDIVWDGQTWTGSRSNGTVALNIELPGESVDTDSPGAVCYVSGIDSALINELTGDAYQGNELAVYLGFFTSSVRIAANLHVLDKPMWKGFLDSDTIEDNGTSARIAIHGENRLVSILNPRSYRLTQADQEFLYPGQTDTFFKDIELIQDLQIPWGKEDQ